MERFAVVVILDFYCQSAHDNPLVGPKYYSRPLYNTPLLLLFLIGLLLELLLIPPSPFSNPLLLPLLFCGAKYLHYGPGRLVKECLVAVDAGTADWAIADIEPGQDYELFLCNRGNVPHCWLR